MEKIELIARFFIHENRIEEFKKIASECVELVKEKEPDTMQYDWFFNTEKTECAVIEVYKDSDAALLHMGNLAEELGKLMEMADFKAEVYGEMSDELKKAAQGLDLKIYSHFRGK